MFPVHLFDNNNSQKKTETTNSPKIINAHFMYELLMVSVNKKFWNIFWTVCKFAANLRSQHEIQNHNWTIHPGYFLFYPKFIKHDNVV